MIVTIVKRVKIVCHVDGKLNYPHAATSRNREVQDCRLSKNIIDSNATRTSHIIWYLIILVSRIHPLL
jgi:hypothetical protein